MQKGEVFLQGFLEEFYVVDRTIDDVIDRVRFYGVDTLFFEKSGSFGVVEYLVFKARKLNVTNFYQEIF